MLPIVLVNGRPNLLNAPNVCSLHTLLLAIVSIMHVLHSRRLVHQALQLCVGIARIKNVTDLAEQIKQDFPNGNLILGEGYQISFKAKVRWKDTKKLLRVGGLGEVYPTRS